MMTKVDLPKGIQDRIATLQSKLDQLEKEARDFDTKQRKIRARVADIQDQIRDLANPFKVGDIVRDEKDVEYRVTGIRGYSPTGLVGIRLNKQGVEAYEKPRSIHSPNLTKVEVTK
jgi:hypothetical protein